MSLQTDILSRFAAWVRDASADITGSETIDTYYEVGEVPVSLDFGALGDQEIDVYVGEVNVYFDDYEFTISQDIEELVDNESPVTSRELLDALDDAIGALDSPGIAGGTIPAALNVREEQAGRAALAAVQVFLDGDGDDALRRALGSALTRAGFAGGTVETTLRVRWDQIRIGDYIVPDGYPLDTTDYRATSTLADGRVEIVRDNGRSDGFSGKAPSETVQVRRSVAGSAVDIGYDPLTVRTGPEVYATVAELRLGDDVTGFNFGRLVSIDAVEGSSVTLTLDRDGKRKVKNVSRSTPYYANGIAPEGIGRDDVPTALALFERSTAVAF